MLYLTSGIDTGSGKMPLEKAAIYPCQFKLTDGNLSGHLDSGDAPIQYILFVVC